MSNKRAELKIRVDAETIRRLDWGEYCRKDLKSKNELLQEALKMWLDKNEAEFGPPVEATRLSEPPKKRKTG